MIIAVSSIVGMSMNKIALWISVGVDDWTVEKAIIASNVNELTVKKRFPLMQTQPVLSLTMDRGPPSKKVRKVLFESSLWQ